MSSLSTSSDGMATPTMFEKLPWRWIVPVLLIAALGFTVRAYAGALGRADAAAERVEELEVERDSIAESNVTLADALADADSSKAERVRADSLRIAELALETEELERTVRDLAADDRHNAESVETALWDLEVELAPEVVPTLRQLQGAYEARITGLSDQVIALTGIVDLRDEEIELLGVELGLERFARSAADQLLDGLRSELCVQGQVVNAQASEIDALRDAVAPGFFLRLWQNAELVAGVAAVTGAVTYLAFGG